MGYMHIDNLYKDTTLLMFKECYALEKIHGTSAHIKWDPSNPDKIHYFAGGEKHENFVSVFNEGDLINRFKEQFATYSNLITVFGEAYGGKQQGMRETYGPNLKFIAFDVQVGKVWLSVPDAHDVCNSLGIEFVYYNKVNTDMDSLNAERDRESQQAIRNGMGPGKKSEGVVLRPIIELTRNNGARIIVKHKRDDFRETKTPRVVDPNQQRIYEEAEEIACEYVTDMRLIHVLDKLPKDINIESIPVVIKAMVDDIYREAHDIVQSKEATKAIGKHTVQAFKRYLNKKVNEV